MWYVDQVTSPYSGEHVLSHGIYVVGVGCACTTVTVH